MSYRHPNMVSVPIKNAVRKYNLIDLDSDLVRTARGVGISLGD